MARIFAGSANLKSPTRALCDAPALHPHLTLESIPFATIVAASSLLGCTTADALASRLAKPGHARPALNAWSIVSECAAFAWGTRRGVFDVRRGDESWRLTLMLQAKK
jgi:hypothetical protein